MSSKPERKRLDQILVERGVAESRQKALAMILAGEVRVDGQPAAKGGESVLVTARIEVHSRLQKYASRGGLKLEGALSDFQIDPAGWICLDAGSSTGGFVDCLLQHGAARVYAVDVTTNQLAWKLQQDSRVIQVQRNARELLPADVPEPVDFVVADLSFISVVKVLATIVAPAKSGAAILILVKPQFELAKNEVGKGGIVKDETLQEKAVASVWQAAENAGLACLGVRPSHLTGSEGNQEFFLHARKTA